MTETNEDLQALGIEVWSGFGAYNEEGYYVSADDAIKLAKMVLAADKLVDALRGASEDLDDYSPLTGNAIETNAAKRCRAALSEYEATK